MFDLNNNIPFLLSLVFIVGGLALLTWSADRFIDAAAKLARAFGVSPLIVGMVIIGFGTSAPELAVSVLSGLAGHSNLSLGNAYGSCVFNLAAILGVSALIWPLKVRPSISFFAVPLLLLTTVISFFLIIDGAFSRLDGVILLLAFAVLMPLYCWFDQKHGSPKACMTGESALRKPNITILDFVWLIVGLVVLVGSSHLLVWGCVDFARDVLHVSDLLIGLTIVAVGTSLPELASAIVSARKREHEFVIGNIVGSNLFNTLAVVGVAGTISPFNDFSKYIIYRDLPMMVIMSFLLALWGLNWHNPMRPGRIYRKEGVLWILSFVAYLVVMIINEAHLV